MAPDVSAEEAFRLARAMTFKNAAAGLPHGRGKSVIFGDPCGSDDDKEPLIRAFAQAIGDLEGYIPGPDMGTNERCMGWIHDEIGRAVGLPPEIGGIPLDEIGATGLGLAVSAEVASGFCDLELDGARVGIQGYGNVGRHAARLVLQRANIPFTLEPERFLHEKGVLVVPDFIANAGGVICASVEDHGGDERQALKTIETKLAANVEAALGKARSSGQTPRAAAVELAEERVRRASALRRWHR